MKRMPLANKDEGWISRVISGCLDLVSSQFPNSFILDRLQHPESWLSAPFRASSSAVVNDFCTFWLTFSSASRSSSGMKELPERPEDSMSFHVGCFFRGGLGGGSQDEEDSSAFSARSVVYIGGTLLEPFRTISPFVDIFPLHSRSTATARSPHRFDQNNSAKYLQSRPVLQWHPDGNADAATQDKRT